MTDTATIRGALRAFVNDNFLYMRPDLEFTDDDSLLSKGVIDSLGVMEIVGFVEEEWEFTVDPSEMTERNFGTLAAIADFVASKAGAGG